MSGSGGLNLQSGAAFGIGIQRPAGNLRLAGVVVFVGNAQQFQPALAADRFLVQGLGFETGLNGIADPVVASIQPGIYFKRLAGRQHLSPAHNGAPGLIADFGFDGIAVVAVAVDQFGQRGIDVDVDRAVFADFDFPVGHNFRLLARPVLPPGPDRPPAAPVPPARVPGIVISVPPVSGTVKPVPVKRRIPAAVVLAAQHFIFHGGFGNRGTEIICGFNGGGDLLAEHDRLGRGFHADFKFGFFVFFHPKRLAAVNTAASMGDAVDPQGGIGNQFKLAFDTAVCIGRQGLGINLFIFGVVDANAKTPAGEAGGVISIIFGMPHPGLKLNRLGRTIDRPVGHDQGFGLVVLGVMVIGIPDIGKTQKCQPAFTVGYGHQPGHMIGHLGRLDQHQAVCAGLLF